MMDDDEFMALVVKVSTEYRGDSGYLVESVGLVSVGRLFGWRAMRLISSRRAWTTAGKLFGDLKDPHLMPERGVLYHKSVGLALVDKLGDYWEFIRGHRTRDLSTEDRRSFN